MQPKGGFDPNILAFDTSGPHVSVAVQSDVILAESETGMARGQAEALMPAIERCTSEAGGALSDLDLIAVGVGPGNFTGIRISVAAARGLSLALGIPAFGISTFEALLDWDGPLAEPAEILSVKAPQDKAYVQAFRYGVATSAPRVIDPESPPADLELPVNMCVHGFRAEDIARPFHARWEERRPTRIAAHVARIAEIRWRDGADRSSRPAPLYIRPADAAPSRHGAPIIIG